MYRDEALRYLQWNWGSAYEITEASGVWRAVRLDNQKTLIATEAPDLRDEIVQDYAANPVARRLTRKRRDAGGPDQPHRVPETEVPST